MARGQKRQNDVMVQPMPLGTLSTAMPWTTFRALQLPDQLGEGLDRDTLLAGLQRLIACEGVRALVMFGSRAQGTARNDSDLDLAVICKEQELTSQQRTQRWRTYRHAIGSLGCGVDLVLKGQADAARLACSRWHVMKDVARHGVVLYASL